jgi:hypothetical protein
MTWFEREKVVSIDPNLSPIDYLLARMRDPRTEENVRTRIAIALLPFTSPKLSMVAQVTENDFATLLDQRIKRHEQAKLIQKEAKLIQHQPPPVEVRPPLPRIPDRRFRRI